MNDGTLLLRQVHPTFVQQGRMTSQVFKPTTKDNNELSVYDGDQITADAAWRHYTEKLHLSSTGVVAVAVAERFEYGLQAHPAPRESLNKWPMRLAERRFPPPGLLPLWGRRPEPFDKLRANGLERGVVQRFPSCFPEHAVISFVGIATNKIEKVAKRLKLAAERRGWQYRETTG